MTFKFQMIDSPLAKTLIKAAQRQLHARELYTRPYIVDTPSWVELSFPADPDSRAEKVVRLYGRYRGWRVYLAT